MDLTEAARLVLVYISPLIAAGALAKIGEDATDTTTELLGRVWDTLARRLQGHRKAEAALTLYEDEPHNPALQQKLQQGIVEVFKSDPAELLDLAQSIAALGSQPVPPRQHNQNISGNANVATAIAGDFHGNLTIGALDMSRNKTAAPSQPVPPAPTPRLRISDPTLSADGATFSFGHALIIGVGSYAQPGLSVPGGTTSNDARALAALLRDPQVAAYPHDQVRVLLDAKATRTSILDELELLAKRAHGGTALIFFAGHGEALGGGGYALLPYDADLHNLEATSLSAEIFQQRVAKVRTSAKRLIVLLNCCHAGGVGAGVLDPAAALLSGAAPPATFYQPLTLGSGQAVISASRPQQKAGARAQSNPQHTPFGAQLLTGLRGQAPGDGAGVGVFELFAHLRTHVPSDALHITYQGAPLRQEPLFYAAALDDNIPLALRPGWNGTTLGDATLSLARRLAELEIAAESVPLTPAQIAERDSLLARIKQTG
ncbi:hypothetical protein OSCT_1101 [Oscillochloris trichoides DG-6]|uniref:Peptidase C14 caspase domain-containing protein n=1 Tax=Oscillochloris trichoides DG-6 TaxID=765420 RepID=E1ICQ0_9CHLR|nr:caspase family protein [Oscillochloris trichoides]EFO81070.1 hypothetical protein OSCT_1101 [Oscillochloris trichoides DG-6]